MTRSHLPKRGELAIRALNKARRAAATKPESLNEAVSNKMTETIANREAENLLKIPDNLVRSCGEAVTPEFRLGFLLDRLRDEPTMINVIASELRLDYAACVRSGVAELAVDAAESVQATNSLEKMLCHQMAAAHCAAMKLIARGLDGLDGSLPPVEMARLSNAAARMMQIYQEGLLTLQKIRTGGKQTVVVQHVQVSDGGQALIAGNMKSGEGV
jgi:hypothetical protein